MAQINNFRINVFDIAHFLIWPINSFLKSIPSHLNANKMQKNSLMVKRRSKRYFHGRFLCLFAKTPLRMDLIFVLFEIIICIYIFCCWFLFDLPFDYKLKVQKHLFFGVLRITKRENVWKIESTKFKRNQSFFAVQCKWNDLRQWIARWLNDLPRHYAYLSETIWMFCIVTLNYYWQVLSLRWNGHTHSKRMRTKTSLHSKRRRIQKESLEHCVDFVTSFWFGSHFVLFLSYSAIGAQCRNVTLIYTIKCRKAAQKNRHKIT